MEISPLMEEFLAKFGDLLHRKFAECLEGDNVRPKDECDNGDSTEKITKLAASVGQDAHEQEQDV